MEFFKVAIFSLVGCVMALIVSIGVGTYLHPDNEIMAGIATNRTAILIFYTVWLARPRASGLG